MNNLVDALPTNLLTALIATVAFILSALTLLFTIRQRASEDRYDSKLNKVRMDFEREALERKLSEISRELTATKERWADVNHLVIGAQIANRSAHEKIPPSLDVLKSLGVDEQNITIDHKLIFVLTPFTNDEWKTFETIREACTTSGYRCIRGDEERVTGSILSHVVTQIAKARIVIANIGSRNANVFYELGIAHALGKQTILVSESLVDVPFNLQQRLILLFRTEKELYNGIIQSLARLGAEPKYNS